VNLADNKIITSVGLESLTKLRKLNLNKNRFFDAAQMNLLIHLTSLHTLYLCHNSDISNDCLSKFISLKSLHLTGNKIITNESVSKLTNLTKLYLEKSSKVTVDVFRELPFLTQVQALSNKKMKSVTRADLTQCNVRLFSI